jgi:Uncharacterized protein conserved in bacteria (DUF2188)
VPRNMYKVEPEGQLWVVRIGGQVVGRWRSKDNALQKARTLATTDEPSAVSVHRHDGSVEQEWVVGQDIHPAGG